MADEEDFKKAGFVESQKSEGVGFERELAHPSGAMLWTSPIKPLHVLITGGTGFIGHNVVLDLLDWTDWRFTIVDAHTYAGAPEKLTEDPRYDPWRVRVLTHDLSDPFEESKTLTKDDYDELMVTKIDAILNIASNSHVDGSIEDPAPFIINNTKLVVNMLEFARKVKPKLFVQFSTDEVYGPAPEGVDFKEWSTILPSNPYSASKAAQEAIAISYWRTYGVPVVLTNCWDMETRVMSQDGYKSYDDLQEGDLVWSVDDSEEMVLVPVLEKVRMPGPSEMVRFKARKVDQLVTPNHRMMLRRVVGHDGGKRLWGPIEEAHAETLVDASGRVAIPLTAEWKGETGSGRYFIPEWCRHDHPNTKHLPESWDAGDAAELIGWYATEGTRADWGAGFGMTVHTSRFTELLTRMGLNYIDNTKHRQVNVPSVELRDLLVGECGHLARNKFLPQWLMESSADVLQRAFESLMLGDGTPVVNDGWVYYTTSEKLAFQVSEIAMKLGYGVRTDKRVTWNPSHTKQSESLMVRIRKSGQAGIEKHQVSTEPYEGDVWCIRTPTGRAFVERNGIVSLSGQTMNVLGKRQHPEKFVPKTIEYLLAGKPMTVHAEWIKTHNPQYCPSCIQSQYGRFDRHHDEGGRWEAGSRYYTFVTNISSALRFLIERNGLLGPVLYPDSDRPERFNLVGDREVKNDEMVDLIADILGVDSQVQYKEFVDFHKTRPGHDRRYALDGSALKEAGWTPVVSFEEGLKITVEDALEGQETTWTGTGHS